MKYTTYKHLILFSSDTSTDSISPCSWKPCGAPPYVAYNSSSGILIVSFNLVPSSPKKIDTFPKDNNLLKAIARRKFNIL